MKTFTIAFAATGGVKIVANTEDEAIDKFNSLEGKYLLDELEANGIEMTEVFEEEE